MVPERTAVRCHSAPEALKSPPFLITAGRHDGADKRAARLMIRQCDVHPRFLDMTALRVCYNGHHIGAITVWHIFPAWACAHWSDR